MMNLTKSPLFASRFVSYRHIWIKENDACYECIDKSNYSSVVVRLQRLNINRVKDIEKCKDGIEKFTENAIKHPSLCNLKEVLFDAENNILISCSENVRGITLSRFVTSSFSKFGYSEAIQQILSKLLDLYRVLFSEAKDLSSLNLDHIIIKMNNQEAIEIESIKIRRPFLCKYGSRTFDVPYKNYSSTTFPAFVDIGAMAFYCFTQNDFFSFSNLPKAIEALEKPNEKIFVEQIFGFKTPEFDAVEELIGNMFNLADAAPTSIDGEDESEEEEFDDDLKVKAVINNEIDEEESSTITTMSDDNNDSGDSEFTHDDSDESESTISDYSDESEAVISDDESQTTATDMDEDDETQSDIENEYSDEMETPMVIKNETGEVVETHFDLGDGITLIDTANHNFDIQTSFGNDHSDEIEIPIAIENVLDKVDETHIFIDDGITLIVNEDFDTQTAIENESDEIETTDGDNEEAGDSEIETANKDDSNKIKVFDKFDGEDEVPRTRIPVRKLMELMEAFEKLNEHFSNITKNNSSLASVDKNDSDDVFDTRSIISNDSDYDVIDKAETPEDEAIFTAKNYGVEGLTIKIYKNDFVSYKFESSGENGYFDSSNAEMISSLPESVIEIIPLIRNAVAMAQITNETYPTKKYLATFNEEK